MALDVGSLAPDFELPNQFGEHVRLSDHRGSRPVALVFFPLAFSSTCTSELCELRDNIAMFQDNRIELIGISVDSKATLRSFADQNGYDFDLLADFWPHGAVSKEYGVFLEHKGFANRATFVIDVQGRIRASIISEPGIARDVTEYRAALDKLAACSTPVAVG
ncbi:MULTISPECIES: peroxiredoxin [unclassified Curtobacterium]|jgi:peroxiredoxin|uniref:peroxiredoxin n=1 Tax=unclassified Curtobacterium TaxID=257496 RepID=UPI001889F8AF|nr:MULTISPECIES: peroxiredoxin [unclassified Curtobacterium]MBF4590442.1 peroxiredoxin [Curtobacterium sp. VKM Ac-1395]MCY1695053.1 peroxiredoxin [Curtobacterium sp. SL109]